MTFNHLSFQCCILPPEGRVGRPFTPPLWRRYPITYSKQLLRASEANWHAKQYLLGKYFHSNPRYPSHSIILVIATNTANKAVTRGGFWVLKHPQNNILKFRRRIREKTHICFTFFRFCLTKNIGLKKCTATDRVSSALKTPKCFFYRSSALDPAGRDYSAPYIF